MPVVSRPTRRAGIQALEARGWIHVFAASMLLIFLQMPVVFGQASNAYRFSSYRFSMEPRDALVIPGNAHTLNCSTPLTDDNIIEWHKDDLYINSDATWYYEMLPTGALQILPGAPPESLDGIYYCTIFNRVLGLIESRRARVTSATLGEIFSQPFGVTVYPRDTARFECYVNATAPKVTTWMRNREVLDLTEERFSSRYTLLPSGALEIQDVRTSDAGSYRCQVESPLLPIERRRSGDAVLEVRRESPPNPRQDDLTFLIAPEPGKIEALLGSVLTLEAATTEPATFTWYKGDVQINPEGSHYRRLGQGSLQITEIQELDTGIYKVVATSTLDNSRVERVVKVDVQIPPAFLETPTNTYARLGTQLMLPCNIYGVPPPTVTWKRKGEDVSPSTRPDQAHLRLDQYGLVINDINGEDTGMYQCFASNSWGNIQATSQVIVVPDGPPSGPVATAPRNLQRVDSQPQSITVSWQRPETIPGSLLRYRLYLQPDQEGARVRMVTVNKDQLSKTVTDLLPDQWYRIYVQAENGEGIGAKSEVIRVKTKRLGNGPDEVTDLQSIPVTSTSVELSWRRPFDTHGALLGYRVQVMDRTTGFTDTRDVASTDSKILLDGLDVYTEYEMRVIPYNAEGEGTTASLMVITPGAVPTGMPTNVSVGPAPSVPNALDISWVPPLIAQRRGRIERYRLRYRKVNGDVVAVSLPGELTNFRLESLDRDTDYEIKIAMENVNGTGPYSEWQRGRTEAITPNENIPPPPPTIIQAIPYAHRIALHWDHPEAAYVLVEGYLLGWGENFPDVLVETLDRTARSFELTGLDLNTNYVIKLRAFNQAGEGASVYENVWTREGSSTELVFDAPTEVLAIAQSAREIAVTWYDPNPVSIEKNGIRYYMVLYSNRKDGQEYYLNSSVTNLLVTGLKPFNQYDFKVMVVEGRKVSEFSMVVPARTWPTVPDSPPQEMTIRDFANSSTSVAVSWQPPLNSNGDISEYILIMRPSGSTLSTDMVRKEVDGESLSTVVHNLDPGTEYEFTIMAVNDAGDSPMSPAIVHTTKGDSSAMYPISDAEFPWWMWIAIAAACFLIIALAIALLCCIACGCCGCCVRCCPGCATLCDDVYACLEPCGLCFAGCASAFCPCCCEDEDDCAKCWTKCCCGVPCCVCCGKAYKEKKAKAELTGYKPVANGKSMTSGNTTQVEGNPPDLWADEMIMKQLGKNMAGTPSEMGSLNKSEIENETQFASHAQQQQGYHSDTNASSQDESGSQNSGTAPRPNPALSSFTVPAPPPHYQQHPQAKVRITAPAYSPLKRGQPGPGRGRAQPMAVITPKAPDVTYRGMGDGNSPGSTVRTFSAEDLNAEMMHLEGLMKDLNEITQSELQN